MVTAPTIVLVHGAFADAGSWAPVTRQLLDQGYSVRVPASPNRSLVGDAAYIRRFVEQIDGPVVLVGHSYGGCVITVAGVAENVVGLVYVAGYALEEGESLDQLQTPFPKTPLFDHFVQEPYAMPDGSDGTDLSVEISAFPAVFAGGVDSATATVLAVSQRPFTYLCVNQTASVAAWKSKPAWGIVAANDLVVHPDLERFGYKRAGFRNVTELPAPHLVMHTHPAEVARVIASASSPG